VFLYSPWHLDFLFRCHIDIAATVFQIGDTIEICFKSLLTKIAKAMQLSSIIYQQLADIEPVSYVSLKSDYESKELCFQGLQRASVQISEQSAASIAIESLLKQYNIAIHDVSWDKVVSYKKYTDAYKLEVKQLEHRLGRQCTNASTSIPAMINLQMEQAFVISIDFLQLLDFIASKYHVSLNKPDIISLNNGKFQAGLRVECAGHIQKTHFLMSAEHPSEDDAKQDVAKQAVMILQIALDLMIVDVNYELLQQLWATCYVRHDTCIVLENKLAVKTYRKKERKNMKMLERHLSGTTVDALDHGSSKSEECLSPEQKQKVS